jgi:hypothetical protein
MTVNKWTSNFGVCALVPKKYISIYFCRSTSIDYINFVSIFVAFKRFEILYDCHPQLPYFITCFFNHSSFLFDHLLTWTRLLSSLRYRTVFKF